MTNAIETIVTKLNEVFAEMDAKVEADNRVWGIQRRDAIKAFKADEDNRKLAMRDQWAYYAKLFEVAGGKTWLNMLAGQNDAAVHVIMDKNSKRVAAKRNASIAAKLVKSEVTEVLETTFTHTNDGFNGTFVVNTNKGRKVVTINTVYAGGYNIQCLHLRVLINVK